MTNIQTVSNGTFFTTASAEEIEGQITRGMQWLTLRPGGSLLNLAHVVSIEDDREPVHAELHEVEQVADSEHRLGFSPLRSEPRPPALPSDWPC